MKTLLTALTAVAVWLIAQAPAVGQEKNEIPPDVVKLLEKGGKLEVFYLENKIVEKGEKGFQNFKIRGDPVEVKNENTRKDLVHSLIKGVSDFDMKGKRPRDFDNPSHGLRVTGKDGKHTDILISFATSWGLVYKGDDVNSFAEFHIKDSPIKDSPKKVLNLLTEK